MAAIAVALCVAAGCGSPAEEAGEGVAGGGAAPSAFSLGDIPLTLDVDPALLCAAFEAAELSTLVSIELDDPIFGTGQGTLESNEPSAYCQATRMDDDAVGMSGFGVYPAGAVAALGEMPYCTTTRSTTIDGLPGMTCVADDVRAPQIFVAVQVTTETSLGLQTMDRATGGTASVGAVEDGLSRLLAYLDQNL